MFSLNFSVFFRQIALRALSERLNKVEPSPWPLVPDVGKYAEKSKSINLTMPPVLSPHQSSPTLPTNSSKSQSTVNSDEINRITITHPSAEQ